MFSIFKRNIYLADLIEGITDFHNHILPGIDDGAKNLEDSMNMLEEFQKLGIKNIIASPHVIGEYYPNTPETIKEAFNSLKTVINSDYVKGYSAEYMMDQYFVKIIEDHKVIPLHKNKVLVEMSYFQAPINLNEILFKLQNNSFSPILAHPERYAYLHRKDLSGYKDLKTRGCNFQLNMLSLSDHYGIGIQKTAYRLLEENMIDFISSDAHKIEHLQKISKLKVQKKFSEKLKAVIENNKSTFN